MGAAPVTLLVTRPELDAAGTLVRLRALDIEAVSVPLMVRQVLDEALPDAAEFTGMVVTSSNALRVLAERDALNSYRHLPVFTVGDMTAVEASSRGFANVHSAAGGLPQLAELLTRSMGTGTLFYPAAEQRAGDLQGLLAASAITVTTVPVYRMAPVPAVPDHLSIDIASGEIEAALFYSRRAAEHFIHLLAGLTPAQRARLSVLCLSPTIAEPLTLAGYGNAAIAAHPDEEAMMSLALAFVRARNTP